ncbi:YbaK/aminoacyl-tRNA synthetase-associated domain-containing protein [Chytridium lagenaria]|nr:YbaK/aminoacyl-tRNA synthetase-associated domain-containing protein [Chytridium lagenaria]
MLRLGAPSIDHLCKTIIFENTRFAGDPNAFDPRYSKYYAVVVQYTGKLNTQKLMNYIRDLKDKSISKKNYNMRVAPEEASLNLTGYDTGGVSPIGMKETRIPIILCQAILKLQPAFIWLGCGHIDWKIAFPVSTFIKATGCFVADLE